MDVITIVITVVLIIFRIIWAAFSPRRSSKNLPPGPKGLPIVGYLPFMTSKPHEKFKELSKSYGPVFKVKLGSREMIVITDFKLIKEAFAKDAFFGRPDDLPFEFSRESIETQAFVGPPWKEMRRFSLHHLRDLGFGKSKMEEHLKEEIQELVERLNEISSSPIYMADVLAPSMSNNIASFVFGNRMKYNDPKRLRLDKIINTVGRLAGSTSWTLFFPWIRAVNRFFLIGDTGKLLRAFEEIKKFCWEEITEHEKTLDPNNIRDFIDGFLLEMRKKEHDSNGIFKREVLADLSRAFFGAGSETVRVTVEWVILVVSAFPHVQKKIHDEIDDVLGKEGFPSWEDRHRMPFTEAVIMETMRWKSIIPLNILRSTLTDTELNGYLIPKNSRVMAVLWSVDHDESLWGNDVFQFKPERFLNEDGKKVSKPEYFIPFSIGKRSCPGKSLAEVEVFLYVTTLLQKFTFSLPIGTEADLEGELGIGLRPKRQELYLKQR